MAKYFIGCLGLLVVIGIVAALSVAGIYNNLLRGSQGVDAQWAQVENVYQRRADLIPNLVNTVSGAANFEKSTLVEVTNARASVGRVQIDPATAPDSAKLAQFQQAQGALSGALSRLLVVAERYPDLKANQNFLELQSQLEGTENRISVERGRFNEAVQSYNVTVQTFPNVLFAGFFGFKEKAYFAAREGSDVPPPVKFDFNSNTSSPSAPAPVPVSTH